MILVFGLGLLGCKSEPTPPSSGPTADLGQADAAIETGSEEVVEKVGKSTSQLTWPDEFADWYDKPVPDENALPACAEGWHAYAIDDEFLVWKCERFGDTGISSEGELAVHTRKRRVFMVTVTVHQELDRSAMDMVEPLRVINRDKSEELTKDEAAILTDLWDLGTSYAGISVGDSGFSVLHFSLRDHLKVIGDLVERQRQSRVMGRTYSLGTLRYALQSVEKKSFVGRSADRWAAKNDADFFVIEYQVENRGKVILDQDPVRLTLVSGTEVIAPDPRARRALLDADRTGQLALALTPRAKRTRQDVFEVPKSLSNRPIKLIFSTDEGKLIFQVDYQ